MKNYENGVLDAPNTAKNEPIAIVGIGCRFPSGNEIDQVASPKEYWEFLKQGGNAITDVPSDRWSLDEFYDPDPIKAGKIKTRKGGFLKNIGDFDASFFGFYPAEANRIDPQQRILMEVTLEALEDAGIKLEEFSGTKTAVYVGMFMNDYWDIQTSSLQRDQTSPHVAMGASRTSGANRLSYLFNLKGPSVTIDTACSSSLVGVHLACQSIWTGESEIGLAGGVNLILRPESSILMSKGNFLSPDGHCKSFDSRANGYVRSEGCGMVLLKPLSRAEADGDHIYATILGSAVNQDGYTEDGFTVPSVSSQIAMLQEAYEKAGVNPKNISYVEAHGTGTPVGDPIETKAFGKVIGKDRAEDQKCWMGSVKSNIGHLEAAAGVAGLIKLSLVLKNRLIPQNLHFENPNPKIPFDEYRLRVPTRQESLDGTDKPLIGGVNSFGAGGTNAHIVLQEYIPVSQSDSDTKGGDKARPFSISSKSLEGLKTSVKNFINYLKDTENNFENICYSAATRRTHHDHRLTVVAHSKEELAEHLIAFLRDERRPGMSYNKRTWKETPKIGFIYSGQGPQWFAMGQQLIAKSPLFRDVILKIDKLFSRIADWSLLEEMNKDEESSRVSDTRIAQPAIMAIQIALTELWKSWGINPEGCVGHSIGEIAAAYTAGALTLEQAVEVIYHRSRGQNKATGKGKMLAVALPLPEAKEFIKGFEDRVSIAAINGPEMLTLSGDVEPLEIIAQQLDKQDVFHRFLRVNVPFHSHHMFPLKEELISSLKDLTPHEASTPLYSTVSGNQEDGKHLTSEYWYKNVRETVYFTDAVQSMIDDGYDVFIEVAPHPVLTEGVLALLRQNDRNGSLIVPSLRRKEDEVVTMMTSLGKLHTIGYPVSWYKQFGSDAKYVRLPTYAWQREYCWFETKENAQKRLGTKVHPHLSESIQSAIQNQHFIWEVDINPAKHNYIDDHKVNGDIVFPGTGHLEVAYAAGKASFPDSFSHLENIKFETALFLSEENMPTIRLEISSDNKKYYLCAQNSADKSLWDQYSSGRIVGESEDFRSQPKVLSDIQKNFYLPISVSDYYLELKEGGLQYGETFRRIKKLWADKDNSTILAQLSLSNRCTHEAEKFHFHPTLSDACLHAIEYAGKWTNEEEKTGIYLPTYIEKFKVHQSPENSVYCYIEISDVHAEYLNANYWIFNEDGTLVAEIQGLECKYIDGSRGEVERERHEGMYEFAWEKLEDELQTDVLGQSGKSLGEKIAIFAERGDISEKLINRFQADGLSPILIYQGERFEEISKQHYIVNPNEQSDIQQVFLTLLNKDILVDKIIYLWALAPQDEKNIESTAFQSQQEALINALLNTIRSVVSQGLEPTIQIITQGVELIYEGDSVNISQAAIYGISRVMMNEYPFITTRIVDISSNTTEEELDWLYQSILSKETIQYPEMALRGNDRLIRTLIEVSEETAEESCVYQLPASGANFRATFEGQGESKRTVFRNTYPTKLGENEVAIEVKATGLSHQDSVTMSDLSTQERYALGWECSGVVKAVGNKVTKLKLGDEVIAWTSACLGGYIYANEKQVVLKPGSLSFREAAGIPVAYLTAYYALNKIAQLEREDWIFVHGATSPVGLAVIQIAQLTGANVIASIDATSDNTYGRTYLRSIGVEHVVDTSSNRFAEQVLRITGDRGVDAIANIFTRDSVMEGFKCLVPYGKYIDLRFERERKLQFATQSDLSYHSLNIEHLYTRKPALSSTLLHEIVQLFDQKKLKGLPTKVYPIQDLNDAVQKMVSQNDTYIGKTVVSLGSQPINVKPALDLQLPSDATYLITGGASGFGLTLAKWLSTKGARHLALMSRSGCKLESDFQSVDRMKADGVQVYLANVDITNEPNVQKEIDKIRRTMPPIKGIVHSAAVLDDATLQNTDLDRFMKVFRPKVVGAWNLHMLTQNDSLDFFLMISSISSLFGLPGQAAYSSANNFLDKLAHYRQSLGLSASSINLGVLGQYAGMSRDGGNVMNVLSNQGWLPLSVKQVTDKIESILLQKPAQRMVANLDWSRFKNFFTHLENDVRFAKFLNQEESSNTSGATSFEDEMLHASPEQKQRILKVKLSEALAKILGTSAEKIDADLSIAQLGLDSLMLNQLRNWIQQKLGINFPLMKIAKGPSIGELAAMLVGSPPAEAPAAPKKESSKNEATAGFDLGDEMEIVNEWFVRNKTNKQEIEQRIFCIHPVGAGATMFSHFLLNPPKNTDVLSFQLPGRENRSEEAPYEDIEQLIPDLANAIRPYLDKPFIVIGHSFGGIIGFELIRFLWKHHGIKALQLFVSGTIAPQLTQDWKKTEAISKTAIRSYSEEKIIGILNYIDDVDFLRQILPVMRNDMPLLMSYRYADSGKLDIPIAGFAASKDEVVSIDEVDEWRTQTSREFTLEVLEGDHWFLSRNQELILQRLTEALEQNKFFYENNESGL
ncbi:acyl transferase domain-containing protein/NADPH:quinone reductase-like Zn-dependent oxidoreductase/surfactin synthase thioesterase subunit/acyl carrier protein [Catalinimonas alkaloidigena]|uniref:type I polyketide synthase n=1 Tax=Catalinimonas alkaloidigena TaxID=1075417 RepID=UPI00240741AE|nr:type I polyketide synthase [Catalinimonas alkaloidigena]MDF9798522.1 acyl transferase domain-containing protein/NADPH:quinone reductase-like Zn-dependent oxidoreductase/surfactin synthase thioesterase subunit/acyl carrier protein [Catalinimonas alkaloidigena]